MSETAKRAPDPAWSYTVPVVDKEQRRYEIAKDVLAGLVANNSEYATRGDESRAGAADYSVLLADALLARLEKKP